MNRKGYETSSVTYVPDATSLLSLLEPTADRVWLSRTVCCDRCTLRGVPAKRVDVLVERLDPTVPGRWYGEHVLIEVGRKEGRFDGATRGRIVVRRQVAGLPCDRGTLTATEADGRVVIDLDRSVHGLWHFEAKQLRTDLAGYEMGRIISWHWTRYFQFLDWSPDVHALADSFSMPEGATLSDANREASRRLYRLARDLGWRKLTLREQAKLRLTGQWHRAEVCAAAVDSRPAYPLDGVGQYTHELARWADREVG